jgi:chorismate--pyruvate lyase
MRFELDLISQNHAKPYRDESDIMSLKQGEQSLVRQVRLRCGDQVQIFARSVIPLKTLHGKAQRLRHLGKRPLAELLYTTRSTQRLHMQYGLLKPDTPLYKLASDSLNIKSHLWARRSVFIYENSPLLVCEVFSPRLLQQVPA